MDHRATKETEAPLEEWKTVRHTPRISKTEKEQRWKKLVNDKMVVEFENLNHCPPEKLMVMVIGALNHQAKKIHALQKEIDRLRSAEEEKITNHLQVELEVANNYDHLSS